MPNIYDELQKKLDLEKKEEGISTIDIAQLPSNLRQVMRIMLREVEINRENLEKKISQLPEKSRISEHNLTEALQELTKQGWLIKRGLGEKVTYQVNLRRKAGSALANSIWSKLEDRISGSRAEKPDETAD
jgi:hypothetical protein